MKADLMLLRRVCTEFSCKWQVSMRVAGRLQMRNLVIVDESHTMYA